MEDDLGFVVRKSSNRVLPGFERESNQQWQNNFFFVQAADTQLGLMSVYGHYDDQNYLNVTWDKEVELCHQSVKVLNAMRPRPAFFIVCGDLVDAFPEKWPDIRKRQERDLLKVYSQLDSQIPLVCVCGNHDIGNKPTPETVAGFVNTFGDDYFAFWNGGVHFIVLNSQFYEDCSETESLAAEQDAWLDQELKHQSVHSVVFQHIPWFLKEPSEDKNYFNIEIKLRMQMLNRLYNSGVRKIFCGHYHRNAGGWFKDMEVVVTSAIGLQLGSDTHGLRIVKVKKSGIEHEYHSLYNCPSDIDIS